jgi:steroid 5-alpha reductase family enzyme
MEFILWALLISVGFNLLLFLPAFYFKTDRLTDLSYSLTFIILAVFGFAHSAKQPAQTIMMLMVLLWAVRLGGFLFIRISKTKKDSRFDKMRDDFGKFFRFWFFQGLTVFVVMATALALWNSANTKIDVLSYLGWIVFGLGLALEAIADFQKYRFSQHNTKKTWIDTGFWRISRHPNYLGEMMVWLGVYLFAFGSLSGLAKFAALASPLYIILILIFVSGIPLVETAADKRWGGNKDYEKYKKEVPVLVPSVSSLKRLN